jgi:hypothetical protein
VQHHLNLVRVAEQFLSCDAVALSTRCALQALTVVIKLVG